MSDELERMKNLNHLSVETWVDGVRVNAVPVADPFHCTRIEHEIKVTFWELVLLFFRQWPVLQITVKVAADGVATKRWFQRAVICDRCKHNRIDDPHHPAGHDHGYHHGDQRWCEDCYYEVPVGIASAGVKVIEMKGDAT